MLVMMPWPWFSDCCEIVISPAMCRLTTVLPTTLISNDGNVPGVISVSCFSEVATAGVEDGLTKSLQVSVFAGIWMTVLQGTTIVRLFTTTVPPQWACVSCVHSALLTRAS